MQGRHNIAPIVQLSYFTVDAAKYITTWKTILWNTYSQ